jgi:hypothetical protein
MINYQSDSLTSLIPALLKAQSKLEIAEKSKKTGGAGRSWKYADWPTIVEASRKALSDQKLCVSQRIIMNDDSQMILSTTLFHESGEYLDSRMPLWVAPTASAQDIGSRMTYFKRYAYMALIGIVTDEEDDDGARDKIATQQYHNTPKPQPVQKQPENECISSDQLEELKIALEGAHPNLITSIYKKFGIMSLDQLKRTDYRYTIDQVRSIREKDKGPQ